MDEIQPDGHTLSLARERAQQTRKILMEIAMGMGVEVARVAQGTGLTFGRRDDELDGGDGIRWIVNAQYSARMNSVTVQGHPHLPSQIEGVDVQEVAVELARVMGSQDATFSFVVPWPWPWLEAAYAQRDAPDDAGAAAGAYDPELGAKLASFADLLEESVAGEIVLAPGVELKDTLRVAAARLRDGA